MINKWNFSKLAMGLGLLASGFAFANSPTNTPPPQSPAAQKSSAYEPKHTWKPYFTRANNFQYKEAVFSQINLGVGFLYFSDIVGNIGNMPTNIFSMIGSAPDKEDLSYSKTPLFEYVIGYQFANWIKFGLSYQNQSNIYLQTRTLAATGGTDPNARVQFGSEIQLNSLIGKLYFELPYPLIIKALSFSPYIGGGPGVSWQSWYNITDRIFQIQNGVFIGTDVPYRQKTIANIAAMIDAGIKVHSAYPNSSFSMTAGCKYNYWGQTRNLGKLEQQGNFKRGLIKPFRIKSLYSFAPYIGFLWDFPVSETIINNRSTNTEDMFFLSPDKIYKQPCVTAQLNIGPTFLYFSKLRGNLAASPQSLFFGTGSSVPLKNSLSYVRSPLVEYILAYKANRWLEMGLSYQYLNQTMISSRWLPGTGENMFASALSQFQSYLNLNAIMARFSLDIITGVIKNMAFTPFISAGVGPSWQSWTDSVIQRTAVVTNNFNNNFLYLRDTIVANASWMGDAGIKVRNSNPDFLFSLVAGCKYNQWGQVRNIGKITKQNGLSMGLTHPITVKMMYSFTPYLGMQWDFPVDYNYVVQPKNKCIYTWAPFFINTKNIQKRFSLFVQANVGPGLLFFDKIRGNFGGMPWVNFTQHGLSPFKSHLRYNITPLYEFIIGYRFLQWFQSAISYQTQKSIFVSTAPLVGFNAVTSSGASIRGAKNQLRAQLTLDAFMIKLYFEAPWAMVFKGYAFTMFIAGSPGIGWQSWTNIRVNRIMNAESSVGLSSFNQSLRQKIIANFVWMAESGISVRNASPNFPFSGVFGCKYIQWGQSRNIGKMSQQANNMRLAITQPFSIKVLGSIVPYIGLQWNF